MKIGLFGGAFDPPHNAHLEIARTVRAARKLDRVDLLVSAQSPHAGGKSPVASVEHRLAMVRLAVGGETGLGVEECETRRAGTSYTVDTLRELHAARPDDSFYFIVGGDMLADLPNWREIDEVLSLAEFIPVFRPAYTSEVFAGLRRRLGAEAVQRLQASLLEMPLLSVSSTAIRAAVASGESISHWVPSAVEAYIRASRIYLEPA